jgi:DNA polymerase III subunit epsilon
MSCLTFLDIETTGLDPVNDSIIEIACVKVYDLDQLYFEDCNIFHQYFNTDQDISAQSFQVHGISKDFLKDKPYFNEMITELSEFLGDSTIIAHNASFDISFLNAAFVRFGLSEPKNQVIDSLLVAKAKYPGSPAGLDALMKRFGMNSRGLHSALEDTKILAKVYACMHKPTQVDLFFESQNTIVQEFQICQKVIS